MNILPFLTLEGDVNQATSTSQNSTWNLNQDYPAYFWPWHQELISETHNIVKFSCSGAVILKV